MRVYLIKNKSSDYKATSVDINPSESLANVGVEGSVEIQGNSLALLNSPESTSYPPASTSKTECFEIDDNGLYAVEIDGVVVPLSFRASQLTKYFNWDNPTQIVFRNCEENTPPELVLEDPK